MTEADIDHLMNDLEAYLDEVIRDLPCTEEEGGFVMRVPDLDAMMHQFIAERPGEVA